MKLTILSHNVSSNAVMRAHRLALAARTFADVELIGPVERKGPWPALPPEPWVWTVRDNRFPRFFDSLDELVGAADGDVLVAVKPHLASFGVALVAAERRQVPVVLDLDDLDVALAPRSQWATDPNMADLARPRSPIYVSLLTRAIGAASRVTVASTALQRRFGGTLIPHGCDVITFDPSRVDREQARRTFGFNGPTVLFPGTPRTHKGMEPLAQALARLPGARLAVTCRPQDLAGPEWERFPLDRVPFVRYPVLPQLLAAADVVAIPQLDREPAQYQTPIKVFDAMAMAKPIVATTVSDLPLILEGCGRLVPPNDVDQLASAILHLLNNPDEARSLGEHARARCLEHYSMERIGAKLLEVVRGLAVPTNS
ncbi:MAG: glycosyltransferase [Planctomycetes bacterium]|nr:glycosyltransferase [Planctomycetota bacterium]